MRWIGSVALLAVLAGCGGGDASSIATESPAASQTPSAPATSRAPDPAASAAEAGALDAVTAIRLCTEGLAGPDQKLLTAIKAAREGTRSPAEVAEAFREVQDSVEALVPQVPSRYPRLAAEFQSFADTLGRARVSGDVGVSELIDAKEALNAVCESPA